MTTEADDIDRIMSVMRAAFDPEVGEAWSRRQVEDALMFGTCHYLLANAQGDRPRSADDTDETAGFALIRQTHDEEELLLFAVAPPYRRQGIGDRLLAQFVTDARVRGSQRLLLEMRRGNPAESLYTRNGFAPVGLRRNYYRTLSGSTLDAITFARAL